MICLGRPTVPPIVLCYAGATALVFAEISHLLRNGHWVDGVMITEPVSFPSVGAATALGQFLRGATVVSTYDETRDQNGKLIALTPRAGVLDVLPTPRASKIADLTAQQLTALKTQYAAAIAAAGIKP